MRTYLLAALVYVAAAPIFAAGQDGGLAPEWEVRKQMAAVAEHVKRFEPVLAKVDPSKWENAPAGYVDQLIRVQAEIRYLTGSTQALSREPERLTLALESYFRMVAVDQMLRSLEAGIRKYQNAAVADLLQSLLAEETSHRERLRQYIVDLAADREQQFKVVDEEAQRCRGALARQPRSASKSDEKKEERR